MWAYTCSKCNCRRLFGVRSIVGLQTVAPGIVVANWACPVCGHVNAFVSGSAVAGRVGGDAALPEPQPA